VPPGVRTGPVLAGGALLWAVGVTAARTVRPPNDFAEAHWLLDYRFGFVRRGLSGSILRELSWMGADVQTEGAIRALSYATFGVLCAALVLVLLRVAVRTGWNRHMVLLLAAGATSPFVVTNAHLMGYQDHLVFLLALGAVGLTLAGRAWWGASLAAISVFVHESTVLFTIPLVAVATALAGGGTDPRRRSRWLPLALPAGAFAAVALLDAFGTDRRVLRQLLELRLHRYPFVQGDMHRFVPEWLTTTFADNVAAQRHRFLERLTDPGIVVSIVPALQALWFAGLAWVAASHRRRTAWWLVAVSCAPLALHLSAWDTARIWSYTLGASLIGTWIAVERLPGSPSAALSFAPLVAGLAWFANVAGRIPLLDGAVERFSGPQLLMLYAPAALLLGATAVVRPRSPAPARVSSPPSSDGGTHA